MTRKTTTVSIVVLALAALGVSAVAAPPPRPATPSKPAQPARKEVGALVMDGIPEVPARIGERLFQYQNARAASLQDFAPDGKGVLIATRFGQTAQIHYVAAPGADRQQWTFYNEPVASAAFDPARPAGGFWFSKDLGGNEFSQIFWYDKKAGRETLLTDGKSRNVGPLVWDRGGKYAYASTQRNGKDFDIWVKEGSAEPKLVKEVAGQWIAVSWSPDGKRLLLKQFVSINESYLHVLDLATGQTTEVNPQNGGKKIAYGDAAFDGKGTGVYYTSDEDAEYQQLTWLDLKTGKKTVITSGLRWDVDGLAVSKDGKQLAWRVNAGGTHELWLAAAATPKKARKLALTPGVIGNLGFDPKGARLGFSMSAATGPSDVYTADVRTLKVTQWTFSEVGGLDRTAFVSPSLIEYESFDKLKIPAWVYKPRAAGRPVPVIINIHGGPESQSQAGFGPLTQYLVNDLGVAVIYPNVRGSAGYGKTYLTLDNGFKRQDSVKDIGALLDWIAAQPDLDKSRVAVMGGSYGGFMVLASLVAYADRLRCGIDIVGISHFVTFLENTEDYRRDLRRAEYGDERDPKMKAFLHEVSPLTNVKKIKAPLYVVQGLNDPRVPASEAEQIVKTLRAAGGKVWYLLAKDEGHGFKKKSNNDYLTASMVLFFEEHLLK